MPQEMDILAKLQLATNLPQIKQEVKQFLAEINAEVGHAPRTGAVFQAAGQRAQQIAQTHGIGDTEFNKWLGSFQRMIDARVQSGGGVPFRRGMAEGGYQQETFKPRGRPLGTPLSLFDEKEEANQQRLRIRNGMRQSANLQEALAADDQYTELQKRITAAKGTQQARLVELQNADDEYATIQKRIAAAKGTQRAKLLDLQNADDEYASVQKRLAAGKGTQQAKLLDLQNADDEYASIQKRIAAGKGTQQAKLLDLQNADDEYASIQKRIAAGKGTQQAKLLDLQNADDEYTSVQKRIAAGKGTQQAKLIEAQNADEQYSDIQKRLVAAKGTQQAKLVEAQNADTQYAEVQKRLTVAKANQQGAILEAQNSDGEYAGTQKRVAQAKATQAAMVLEAQNADGAYAEAQRRVSAAKQTQAADVAELMAGDAEYLVASARVTIARQQQSAEISELLANDIDYAAATARVKIARQQQAANVAELLSGDAQYLDATLRASTARKEQAAQLLGAQNADPQYQAATQTMVREREVQKAQAAEAALTDTQYKEATLRTIVAREQAKAEQQEALAADPAYVRATVQAAAAKEQQALNLKAGLAADDNYIAATAMAARVREEQSAKVALSAQGISYQGMGRQELLATAALAKRTETDLQAASTAKLQLAGNRRAIEATVSKTLAESQVTAELRQRERAELRARIKSGEAGGTFVQRLQALVSPTARAPQEYATGPQLAGQKTITSFGYAFGGAAVAAGIFGTIEALKEASKLQEQFAGLRGQMKAIGQEESFGEVRTRIKEISSETGIASSEVTKFASRLLGVFNDPQEAMEQTDAAMKLAVVSGTDLGTMLEELVPTARAFGVSIEDIGDLAVTMHDKFGVAEESMLHFLGQIAPVAEEAGLSLEDTMVIGAHAANSIGKSLDAAGEQFSKVLPTMRQNQDKIFAILRTNPETSKLVDPLVDAFGRGDTGQAFKLLLADYGKLNTAQQQSLVHVSGGRREWALLNGLFGNSAKLLHDMSDAENGVATGALERRFDTVSATLSRSVERIQEAFKNIAEGFFSSGIGDALALVGKAIETVFGLVSGLIGAFTQLNEVTRKLPGFDQTGLIAPFVQFALTLGVASKAYQTFQKLRAGSGGVTSQAAGEENTLTAAVGRRSVAYGEGKISIDSDTAAKERNVAATGEAATAEGGLATAREGEAAATGEAAAAEGGLATSRAAAGNSGIITAGSTTVGAPGIAGAGSSGAVPLWRRAESGLLVPGRMPAAAAGSAAASGASASSSLLWQPGLNRYINTETGNVVSAAEAEAAGSFSHLPAPPTAALGAGLFARSPLLTRAFQGGGIIKSGAANQIAAASARKAVQDQAVKQATQQAAAKGLTEAETKAAQSAALKAAGPEAELAAAGAITGQGLGAIATSAAGVGIAALGAYMVWNARNEQGEALTKQGDEMRGQIEHISARRARDLADANDDMWTKAQFAFLGAKSPAAILREEANKKEAAGGIKTIQGLQDSGTLKQFTEKITEKRVNDINDILNKNTTTKDFARDVGVSMEGNVVNKLGGLAERAYGITLPGGIGQGTAKASREDLEKALPEIRKRAEAGDETAKNVVQQVEAELKENKALIDVRTAVQAALGEGDVKKAIEIGGISEFLQVQGLYDPEGQLQAGKLSRGAYVVQVRQKVDDLRRQLASQQLGGDDREATQKAFDQALQQANAAEDQINEDRLNQAKSILSLTSAQPKSRGLQLDIAELKRLSPVARQGKVGQMIQSNWDAFQERLTQATSPQEWLQQSLAGTDIDVETQKAEIEKNIGDSGKLSNLATLANPYGTSDDPSKDLNKFLGEVYDEHAKSGESISDIIKRRGENKLRPVGADEANPDLKTFEDTFNSLSEDELSQMNDYMSHIQDAPVKIQKAYLEMTTKQANSVVALGASGTTDPYAKAQADLAQANNNLALLQQQADLPGAGPEIQTQINDAQKQVNDAQLQNKVLVDQTAHAQEGWAIVLANGDPLAEHIATLNQANNDVARTLAENGGNEKDPRVIEGRQRAVQIQQSIIDDRNNITLASMRRVAGNALDPEKAADLQVQIAEYGVKIAKGDAARIDAQAALDQALRQQHETRITALRARLTLEAFDRNRDPQEAAKLAATLADIAVAESRGKGTEAESQALTQQKEAQRQIQDANAAVVDADANLAIKLLQIRGDSVGAARKAIEVAQRKLEEAKTKNLGKAAIDAAVGELAQSRADAIDVSVTDANDMTNYLLEMGQITAGQAIARMKVERDKYEVGSKKWRDLQLQIHSMEQSAKTDTQYNLPANITLPTLYEARRLNQSRAMGVGYMDNRNVTLTFNVNGAQDPTAVTNQIVGALQTSMGGGQVYSPGVTVGAFN